jgi:hypothetical protein
MSCAIAWWRLGKTFSRKKNLQQQRKTLQVTATLTFTLPEEQEEFYLAAKGADWRIVLEDMDNYLRGRLKHEDLPEDVAAALDAARERLYTLVAERGLSLR